MGTAQSRVVPRLWTELGGDHWYDHLRLTGDRAEYHNAAAFRHAAIAFGIGTTSRHVLCYAIAADAKAEDDGELAGELVDGVTPQDGDLGIIAKYGVGRQRLRIGIIAADGFEAIVMRE